MLVKNFSSKLCKKMAIWENNRSIKRTVEGCCWHGDEPSTSNKKRVIHWPTEWLMSFSIELASN
jgi:hypothetical protein